MPIDNKSVSSVNTLRLNIHKGSDGNLFNSNSLSGFDSFAIATSRIFDFCVVFVTAYAAFFIRFQYFTLDVSYQSVVFIGGLLVFVACSSTGVYASWRGRNRSFLFGRLLLSWFLAFSILFGLLVFTKQSDHFSRVWMALWMLISLIGALVFRIVVYAILGLIRARGWNQKRVLILGNGPTANSVIKRLHNSEWIGYRVVGVVPMTERCASTEYQNIPCLNEVGDLTRFIDEQQIKEAWICLPLSQGERIHYLLDELRHSTVDIRYAPDMSDLRLLNHKVSEVAGIYTLDLSCAGIDGVNLLVKKVEDIILASLILIAISPLLVLISLGIKLSSSGPILFKQHRHGIDGKPIKVYKFRTMYFEEDDGSDFLPQAKKSDPRVTPFGAFLRKTSLDELPQFYNVLQGRMSIVGPRPHALSHNEYYKELIASYMQRHKVKPGITGWAQIHGLRGETDTVDKMEKRIEYDLFYIENWSIWLDIKIVCMTVLRGFSNENAY